MAAEQAAAPARESLASVSAPKENHQGEIKGERRIKIHTLNRRGYRLRQPLEVHVERLDNGNTLVVSTNRAYCCNLVVGVDLGHAERKFTDLMVREYVLLRRYPQLHKGYNIMQTQIPAKLAYLESVIEEVPEEAKGEGQGE